ncbi:MAG TPA: hypothetical protein VLF62_04230 [Candidatus Saccharimonadales bacterium]|nr:hypothetical protein [Candidatus Saccharimonadales bacterium]
MIFTLIVVAAVVLALGAGGFFFWRRRPQPLDPSFFQSQWKQLQQLLRDKAQWSKAVLDADELLETALKKKRIRGHTMGERLVRAQRLFTDNDSVWFGHKLRNKIDTEPQTKLKEAEVKQALVGIRQALKDVGALPDAQSRNQK